MNEKYFHFHFQFWWNSIYQKFFSTHTHRISVFQLIVVCEMKWNERTKNKVKVEQKYGSLMMNNEQRKRSNRMIIHKWKQQKKNYKNKILVVDGGGSFSCCCCCLCMVVIVNLPFNKRQIKSFQDIGSGRLTLSVCVCVCVIKYSSNESTE